MLKIYSTYSIDYLYNENDVLLSEKKGGPAYFIEQVYRDLNLPFEMNNGNTLKVKIKIENGVEKGSILNKGKSKNIYIKPTDKNILVSTIGREWFIPQNLNLKKIKIFLDIQGYVRTRKEDEDWSFLNSIFCIKGTEEEVKTLPKNVIDKQKKKCLVITKGEKGAKIYYSGKLHRFTANPVKAPDTIGAGDTFFAIFVCNLIKDKSIEESGVKAIKYTEKFLKRK